ncbi:Ku family protein [Lacipirellula limnantheis]|uniref:hypothetical protein n=1 Tax=Lacipirellula limnantheis TaxID=2528024 RepID=UPI0011AA3047|nr:hypothetical protein [Lacipirellula limnantheis]
MRKPLTASPPNDARGKRRSEEFEKELHDGEVVAAELKLARTLILATRAKEPELESYHDLCHERLRELIDAEVAGHEVSRPPSRALPRTINIMDALWASLQKRARAAPKTVAKKARQ